MSFSDKKLEIAILTLSVTVVVGLGYVLKTPVQKALLSGDIAYEMPRIKKSFLASLFDLGDRDIERTYTNPFAKKSAEDQKHKEEIKKAAAAAAAVNQAAKKAVAKKDEKSKKPKVQVTTVESNPTKQWGDDGFMNTPQTKSYQVQAPRNTTLTEDKNDKQQMTADQWRALILAQPTQENVSKLISAYANKEIDDETYYIIVSDLMKSNKSETQSLGLTAAKAFYNARSFTVTAQYYDQLAAETQAQAHNYLLSYAVAGRLGILATVLKSSSLEAVTAATEVVVAGYQSAGSTTTKDPRTSRGNVVTNSVSNYAQFIPIFQELAGNSDANIASLASSALSQLQQSSVAAL